MWLRVLLLVLFPAVVAWVFPGCRRFTASWVARCPGSLGSLGRLVPGSLGSPPILRSGRVLAQQFSCLAHTRVYAFWSGTGSAVFMLVHHTVEMRSYAGRCAGQDGNKCSASRETVIRWMLREHARGSKRPQRSHTQGNKRSGQHFNLSVIWLLFVFLFVLCCGVWLCFCFGAVVVAVLAWWALRGAFSGRRALYRKLAFSFGFPSGLLLWVPSLGAWRGL